jgi:hypothetical protein
LHHDIEQCFDQVSQQLDLRRHELHQLASDMIEQQQQEVQQVEHSISAQVALIEARCVPRNSHLHPPTPSSSQRTNVFMDSSVERLIGDVTALRDTARDLEHHQQRSFDSITRPQVQINHALAQQLANLVTLATGKPPDTHGDAAHILHQVQAQPQVQQAHQQPTQAQQDPNNHPVLPIHVDLQARRTSSKRRNRQ